VRLVGALLVSLLLAACGAETGDVGVPASSALQEPVPETSPAERPDTSPPPVVLVGGAGEQRATINSYCVVAERGEWSKSAGICVDGTWPHPKRVSVVRPGEEVTVLVGAHVQAGSVSVLRLGCERDVFERFRLARGEAATTWNVDLEPGAYELWVFARFAGDTKTGDVSGGLGLVVSPDAGLTIDAGPPRRSNC